MITTIIFDLAEVYIQGLVGVEYRLAPELHISPPRVSDALYGSGDLGELFHGRMTEEEYWSRMIKREGWNTTTGELKRIVRENFHEIEGTREIMTELKGMGFKLGLLSVHTKEWIEFCNDKFDYHKLFDSVSYSFEVGVSKPNKKAYQIILEKLESKPEECIFIDDQSRNLAPARELGIRTIWFVSSKQLIEDLRKEGIVLSKQSHKQKQKQSG